MQELNSYSPHPPGASCILHERKSPPNLKGTGEELVSIRVQRGSILSNWGKDVRDVLMMCMEQRTQSREFLLLSSTSPNVSDVGHPIE